MTGRLVRVVGPLVEVDGLSGATMFEVVDLGPDGIPGEVVAIRGGTATVQAYEYTGGLRPGDAAVGRGHPLSARLGPGLLGGVFDGLLRPLAGAPVRLAAGAVRESGPPGSWPLTPCVEVGALVEPGDLLATVTTAGPLAHRVLVPPGVRGRVAAVAPAGPCAGDAVVAQVGGVAVPLTTTWPIRRPRPSAERLDAAQALRTGQRVLDLLFPVARGSTAAVPGGFGTGKTVLLQQLAKWCDADVIVYVGCGERGNEMADVVADLQELEDPRTGGRLTDRTVIVANTSDMPMMAREASIYAGATVAEYFRDMGYDVVVIADSTSRWAEALREFASRTGALPAEEGFPADLASAIAAFYERAGRVRTLGGREGSVTVVGAVSPPGGDLAEPVTAQTQRFVRCVWTLDRDLAYARHYPAVSWSGSFSRDAERLGSWHARQGDPAWARRRAEIGDLLAEADRLSALAELVGAGALPGRERMVLLAGRLLRESVLQQSALSATDATCDPAKAAALADAVLAVADRCQQLVDAGVPAAMVEETDFTPLVRAREEVGPDDAAGVRAHLETMLARLTELLP
ncbi:MAG: V-type ATP synthase subunit A [Actinomycetia bacterium]|nr:V-type ATP synthase subunit A [Actinomycetes bacterium]